MQAIKNGIKCTLRTPGKTLLFALVLTVLSVLLAVAFCVFSAVRGYLKDADGYFHTIAEMEFIGESYPSRDDFDEGLPYAIEENRAALDALLAHDAVISFTPASNSAALVEGLHRADAQVVLPGAAVVSMLIIEYDEQTALYKAIVSKTFYSSNNYDEKMVYIDMRGPQEEIELQKSYIMSGFFTGSFGGLKGFSMKSITFIAGGETYTTPGFEPMVSKELPEDNVFMRLAGQWSLANNLCRAAYTSAIEDELPFHQQQMKLSGGRFFTEDEYKTGAKAVIVSTYIAYGAGQKKVGDRIKLSLYDFKGDLASADFTSRGEDEYEIVGIFPEVSTYPSQIYIPASAEKAGDPTGGVRAVTGSSLGVFRLKNDRASAFLTSAEKLASEGFRVSVYDQGYAAATEPMRELMLISMIFLAVCIILTAVALVLQSHIFVSRQRETAQTMYSVGASKSHIILYFLSAALLLSAFGSIIGAFIASHLEGRVFEIMQRFAAQFAESDTRFSVARLSLVRTLEFSPDTGMGPYIAAALALILGAAAATLAFAVSALSDRRRAERTGAKKTERLASKGVLKDGTSRLSGRLKYALLSMRRSPARTLAVLLLAASVGVFFSRLTSSLAGYQAQLEGYRRSAVIKGHATDLYGRILEGFLFMPEPIAALAGSGDAANSEMKNMNLTIELGHLSMMGIAITKDGVENRAIHYNYPYTTMEKEMLQINLMRDLKWIGTSTISRSPTFRFRSVNHIRFLEGYSEASFMRLANLCALSESFMREHGIELGDAVMFQAMQRSAHGGGWGVGRIILKVVAEYSSNSTTKTVFSPLKPFYAIYDDPFEPTNPDTPFENYSASENGPDWDDIGTDMDEIIAWRTDVYANMPEEQEITFDDGTKGTRYFPKTKFSSFTFELKDARRLDEARQALDDAGYLYVGNYERTKPYAIIDDEMYLNTVRSMQRQIQYVSVLYASLYVIAGVIGAALAWLLTVSRRKEIALMRALGTPNIRIILNFFFEHALLCLVGLGIGLAAAILIFGAQEKVCFMLSAAFFALWCISTLLCLLFGLTKKTQAALVEAE